MARFPRYEATLRSTARASGHLAFNCTVYVRARSRGLILPNEQVQDFARVKLSDNDQSKPYPT